MATVSVAASAVVAQTAPPPAPTAVAVPVRPSPPTVEEREDPFQPPPTEAERRAEEERRLRDMMRPLIDQARESINQGVSNQIQEGLRGALEELKTKNDNRQAAIPASLPPSGPGAKPTKSRAGIGAGGPGDKVDQEDEKAEKDEARLQASIDRATEMTKDPDPAKREEGRARLEVIRRGTMPKWSSGEGVFFIGCINKRKLYRDRFGDVFQSELWFSGSSGAGGIGGNSNAARSGQTASAGTPAAGAPVAAVDPCTD